VPERSKRSYASPLPFATCVGVSCSPPPADAIHREHRGPRPVRRWLPRAVGRSNPAR